MDGTGASGEQRCQAEFTGTAGEYFSIWTVNLALTVLTLVIYSAWAKVRKRRYFYAHTRTAGESFEYRGRPIAILVGRLFALALLVIVIAVGNLVPELSLESFSGKALFFAAAVVIGPWLLVRSSKFNASNSVYRNIRLSFLGTYGSCFRVVIRYVWLIFFGILFSIPKSNFSRACVLPGNRKTPGTISFLLKEQRRYYFFDFLGKKSKRIGFQMHLNLMFEH